MTVAQKIFLFFAGTYLLIKLVLGVVMYIITLKIQEKGPEFKRRREKLLRARRMKNMELYRRQYVQLEERKRDFNAV
jgi:predicted membrane protein